MNYAAPVGEHLFTLKATDHLLSRMGMNAAEPAAPDLVEAVLIEAGKLMSDFFAPLNQAGDRHGSIWSPGGVTVTPGFRSAYRAYVDGGWGALGGRPEYGGQGMPFALASAIVEQVSSANMALGLCMMLTQGAVEALSAHGSDELKRVYLPRLVSGDWAGTMNLTEPQAGSDVGALRTRASRVDDGTYRIKGTKIFITWGEHDLTGNIVHLVLARLQDAPQGTKGISLFLIPKFLPDEHGNPGVRNDVTCVSVEHKLGIHGSPTCTMSFGDNDACIGWLVGEENAGISAMFTMMNYARINVGLQGVGIGEAAYQHALAYALQRVQSGKFGGASAPVPIVEHTDVQRMLLTMRATTQAARAIACLNASAIDRAHDAGSSALRERAQGLADLLTPVTKAYATDIGVENASLGIQVFGGTGFIEESGAAQYYRDARIAPIYEGTNGIQALDLVGRKLRIDGGVHWRGLFTVLREEVQAAAFEGADETRSTLMAALAKLEDATDWMVDPARTPSDVAAGATPYLRLFGTVTGGCLLACQAGLAADGIRNDSGDTSALKAKITTARFFAAQVVPQALALADIVAAGSLELTAFREEVTGLTD